MARKWLELAPWQKKREEASTSAANNVKRRTGER